MEIGIGHCFYFNAGELQRFAEVTEMNKDFKRVEYRVYELRGKDENGVAKEKYVGKGRCHQDTFQHLIDTNYFSGLPNKK